VSAWKKAGLATKHQGKPCSCLSICEDSSNAAIEEVQMHLFCSWSYPWRKTGLTTKHQGKPCSFKASPSQHLQIRLILA